MIFVGRSPFFAISSQPSPLKSEDTAAVPLVSLRPAGDDLVKVPGGGGWIEGSPQPLLIGNHRR